MVTKLRFKCPCPQLKIHVLSITSLSSQYSITIYTIKLTLPSINPSKMVSVNPSKMRNVTDHFCSLHNQRAGGKSAVQWHSNFDTQVPHWDALSFEILLDNIVTLINWRKMYNYSIQSYNNCTNDKKKLIKKPQHGTQKGFNDTSVSSTLFTTCLTHWLKVVDLG